MKSIKEAPAKNSGDQPGIFLCCHGEVIILKEGLAKQAEVQTMLILCKSCHHPGRHPGWAEAGQRGVLQTT